MKYRIVHRTEYQYSQPVSRSVHLAHLYPRILRHQKIQNYELRLDPAPVERKRDQDYFGNVVEMFVIESQHEVLRIESCSTIEVTASGSTSSNKTIWEKVRDEVLLDCSASGLAVREFLGETPQTPRLPELVDYAEMSFRSGRCFSEALLDLNGRIHQDYQFDTTATTVSTPLDQVVRQRRGVCQDFAHLMIACLRSLRLPARYVSGYLRTLPPPGKPRLVGTDASHAWVSAFSPKTGWLDLDPTNNRVAGQDYITLGWGREYSDVSLIRGVLNGGGEHKLMLSVDVEPLT